MRQESSSTSNSDPVRHAEKHSGWRRFVRRFVRPAAWTLIWLVIIDITLNLIGNAQITSIGLRRFLDYGNSTEAKLREAVGATDDESAPITKAGWLEPNQTTNVRLDCSPCPEDRVVVTFYGMSFAQRLCQCLEENTENLTGHFWGGPGASPSHTFTAFRLDTSCDETNAVVFAILAGDVAGMVSTSGATKNLEIPAPFMYPRYRLGPNGLEPSMPPCNSLSEFRSLLQDPERWNAWLQFLESNDEFYSPLVFKQSVLDSSALVRLVRRGYALSHERSVAGGIYGPKGFLEESPDIAVLRELIRTFAREARDRAKVPVVCLFNNRGYSSHLYDLLHEQLETEGIPYISSHEAAPPANPDSFGADGYHFSPPAEKRVAAAMVESLRKQGLSVRVRPNALPVSESVSTSS